MQLEGQMIFALQSPMLHKAISALKPAHHIQPFVSLAIYSLSIVG